jgi:hypothetical protein
MNAADFRSGSNANLTTTGMDLTYIFTIPAQSAQRNCAGNVVGIQYCYQARASDINVDSYIFNILHMTRNGLTFTVTGSYGEQTTPQEAFCVNPPGSIERVCCETSTVEVSDQFQIPTTNYTFAIMNSNDNVRLLAFDPSTTDYRYEQFQAHLGGTAPPVGNTISLDQSSAVSLHSLLLLRFIVGK